MYCENCGKLIEEGNKFCPYCGTKLVGTEEKVEEEISHEKVVDCSKLEERDLNKVLGKIFEEAYGSAEDGSTTLQKPFVLII